MTDFKTTFFLSMLAAVGLSHLASAQSYFAIDKMVRWDKEPLAGGRYGVYGETQEGDQKVLHFAPSIEAQVKSRKEAKATDLIAKAYFFDPNRRLLATVERPSPAYLRTQGPYEMADIFPPNYTQSLFFPIPANLIGKNWNAVLVFGDSTAVAARMFPGGAQPTAFDFPERKLALAGTGEKMASDSAPPGLIEYVAKTRSKEQPQITMFFKLPAGVTKISELRGMVGRVMMGGVNEIREDFLRRRESKAESLDELAAKYKLGILSWGAHTLWDKTGSLTPEQQRAEDAEFDLVAEGWENGLVEMARKYGIPHGNILLTGISQAAQWSHRLALRKPGRILAIHAHVSSSYDVPTVAGAQTFWLITTGEQDPGCESTLDFYQACRKLGYPMVVKAEPGLGHEASPLQWKLEYYFFEYALNSLGRPGRGREGFQKPAFWGDILSQEVVPAAQADSIEPDNRVPLPTPEIADAWKGK